MKKLNKEKVEILVFIMVLCGVVGFIFETFFYRIDLGYFVKRGTTYGPWIPIYAFGGLFITLITYKFKQKPLLVFLLGLLICTVLEFTTGLILHRVFDIRLWDYNVEILNFGNIGGYICLRSVLLFGLAGLLLVYKIIPMIKTIKEKVSDKVFTLISIIPGILFLIDFIISR